MDGNPPPGDGTQTSDEAARGREWLQATLEVTQGLLGSVADSDPLTAVARAIRTVTRADFVLVILPAGDQTLMVEVAVGEATEHLPGYAFRRTGSISATVLETRRPVLLPDAAGPASSRALRALAAEIEIGSVMFVPLLERDRERGVLAVGRRPGRAEFEQRDVDPVVVLANHGTLALSLADGRMYQQRLQLLEERDRIAAELHDQVLQRLFATGTSLQAMAGAVPGPYARRLEELVEATDETIAAIRTVINDLNRLGRRAPLH